MRARGGQLGVIAEHDEDIATTDDVGGAGVGRRLALAYDGDDGRTGLAADV